MPILEDIDDIVNILLGPAHFNTCKGSGERDISGESSDRECPSHEFLVVLLNKFCCLFSNEQVRRNVLTCSHDGTISGWDNIVLLIIFITAIISVINRREVPFPSVAFGVLLALVATGGSVATAERRLGDLVE
jgi:hypothetical protein